MTLLPIPEPKSSGARAPLGLIAALPWEVRPLLRRQNGIERDGPFYSFSLRGVPVWLAIAGMGAENAFRAARDLIERVQPRALVTLGFAGALLDSLVPGDVVVADRVLDQQTGQPFDCCADLWPLAGVHRGSLLSVSTVIASAAEKRRLAEEWGAIAVDMESAGVARAAAAAGVPFSAIKSITDSAAQSIPIDFGRYRSEHKGLFWIRIVGEAIQTPHGLRDVWMLARGARLAARTLAAALCSVQWGGTR